MFMMDTVLCSNQHLIISNKTRMDKTSDCVYTLRICWLSISLYFLLTCQLCASRYIRQHLSKYWLTFWLTSVASQQSHVRWYSVDMQLILHQHLADTSPTSGWYFTNTWLILYRHLANTTNTWLALVTESFVLIVLIG